MRAQVLKWGNSLAVRIPKPVAKEASLKVGDAIEIEKSKARSGCSRLTRFRHLLNWFPKSLPRIDMPKLRPAWSWERKPWNGDLYVSGGRWLRCGSMLGCCWGLLVGNGSSATVSRE